MPAPFFPYLVQRVRGTAELRLRVHARRADLHLGRAPAVHEKDAHVQALVSVLLGRVHVILEPLRKRFEGG